MKKLFIVAALLFGCTVAQKQTAGDAAINAGVQLASQLIQAGIGAALSQLKPPAEKPAVPYRCDTLYFEFDSDALNFESMKELSLCADRFRGGRQQVALVGHCDERGSQAYNLRLGSRRAAAAAQRLMDLGVPRHVITIVSRGKQEPVCWSKNEVCYSQNRRVVIKAE